jgi:hypothetical protein
MAELDYGKFQSSNTPRTVQENEEIELQGLPEVPRDEPLSYENGGEVTPEGEEDTSFLTKTMNFMDAVVPDDMGGAIRGTSGWIPDIPVLGAVYEHTLGAGLGAVLSTGEAAFNGITWFSSKVSMLSAAAVSAMPGGVQTLTWDEAHEVSFGQAFVGSMAIEAGKLERGEGDFATMAMLPFSLIALGAAQLDTDNSAQDKGFDVKNLQDRKAAFESGGKGQFYTGLSDAMIMVATDPTIMLGGAGTFVRTGAKGGKTAVTAGLTRKRIQTQEQVALHSSQIDVAASMIKNAPGATPAEKIAAARNTKGWPAEGEAFVYAMQGDSLALQGSVYVTGSNKANQKKIVDILKDTSVEDPTLSAATLKVLTGDVSAWGDVRKLDVELYDRLAAINNIESIKGMRLPDGTYPAQTPDGIAVGDELIADAQGYKDFVADPAVHEAFEISRVGMIDEVADVGIVNRGNDVIANSLVRDAQEAGIKLDGPRGADTYATGIFDFRSDKLLKSDPSLKTIGSQVDLTDDVAYAAYMKMFYPQLTDDTTITLYRGLKGREDVFKTTGGVGNETVFTPGFGSHWTTNPIVANGFGGQTKVVSIEVRFGDIKKYQMGSPDDKVFIGPTRGSYGGEDAIVLDYNKMPQGLKDSVKEVDIVTPEGSVNPYDGLVKLKNTDSSGEFLSGWRGQVTNGSDEAVALKEEFFLSKFNPMRDSVQTNKAASIEAKTNPALKWLDEVDESGVPPMSPIRVGAPNTSARFVKDGTLSRKELQEIADHLGPEDFHLWMRTGQTQDSAAGSLGTTGENVRYVPRINENAGRIRDGQGDYVPGWEGVPDEWTFGAGKGAKRIDVPFARGGSDGRGATGAGNTQAQRKQHYIDVQDDMIRQPFEDDLNAGVLDDALDKWMMYQRSIERPKFMPRGTQVPAGYDEATEVISRIHVRGDETALNLINQGGNHMSAKAAYLTNAWRKGKADSSLGVKGRTQARASTVDGGGSSGWVVEALERTSGSRAINVVRWGGKGTAPGFVMLKGLDGERGNKQVGNWLRSSSLDSRASTRLFNEFVDAASEGEKALVLAKMEVEDLVAQAAKLGIGPVAAKAIAARYAAARGKELANARKTKELYAVDDMGNQTVLPEFMRETNSAVPMMDSKQMGHVLRQNAEALKAWTPKRLDPIGRELPVLGKRTTDIIDEINSAWKVSVLLRLGYTQRNLGEGGLRALATHGYLALNYKSMMNLPRNAFNRTEEISYSLAAKRMKRQLIRTQRMLDDNIAELKAMGGRTKAQKQAKTDQRGVIQGLMDETLALKEKIDGHLIDAVASRGKRRLTGEQRTKWQRDNDMTGSFEGPDGSMYRDISSAEATTRRTLDAGANRELQRVQGGHDFVPMDPANLSTVDMGGYWDEFAMRINDKYVSDTFAQRVLAMNPDGSPKFTRQDHIDWINTSEGNAYFREVKGGNYVNETERATRMAYVDGVIKRMDLELPPGVPRSMYAKSQASGTKLTPLQVEKAFKDLDLPTIPGRKVDLDGQSLSGGVWTKYKALTSALMKGLGTVPETKLLRHPFYDNAYKIRQKQLLRLNAEQGVELTASVKASINKASHSEALAQTNDVMYTILEMSNFAESLKFMSPFFASFENSIKTWSKLVYANPALIGISDKVFNIPNNLGLVYDDQGEQVAHSSIFKDNDTFVVLPDPVQDFFTDNDIGSGERMKFRQQGMNMVFPGETAWWPGLGPMSTMPTGLLLRGKPDSAEIIKQAVGEGFYREFVPMGDPNTNMVEYMMPTWMRKLKQMTTGNEDGAYASLKAQMITDAYVKAQINDTTITDKDLKRVDEEANKFWTFQVGAALTMPWQSQRDSPYALQRAGWRKLIEDDSIPYDQKVLDFIYKYGTDFLALTRGRTNNVTGLDSNTQVFNNVNDNADLIKSLESVNPKLVGMLANIGSDEAPYSQAVSQEFSKFTVNGNKVKEKLNPKEILAKNEIGDGWKIWTEVNDILDGRLRELGLSSVNVQGAEGLKAIQESERARLSLLYPAWGQAQESFSSNLGDYIYGLRAIVSDEKFNKLQPKAAIAINLYLNLREATGDAIRAASNNDEKEAIRQKAYSGIIQLRDSNIAFADLFDQFLDRDDFREVSDSGTR